MSFSILAPLAITDSMVSSSTIAEPAAGETLWVSGATYTLGQEVIRSTTHKVYSALLAHTGRATLPELDPTYWNEERPTNKWAPFDLTISTACSIATPCTYVLRPGFINAVRFYGLNGVALALTYKDAPGGTVVASATQSLVNDPLDWYDWAFGVIKQKTKASFTGLTPYADPELTISITAGAGVSVGAGMIALGDYRNLLDGATRGGTEFGATAEPVNFSQVDVNKYGDLVIIDGRKATDMRFKVNMPVSSADFFLDSIRDVLSTPAAVVATDVPGYGGLDCFGLISGSMSYDTATKATFNGYVKGIV
jgi:hypothetical protein